ncbi:helix-hairpin-helix domain-containing protein [Celerinatantimonas sp. MCCC 1A17872]|uniref:helix-hairpin-helix domain-containing protein n=1 Tax=Celerinatantimonas sp. MCCC 1A17872 TaxID=3177514 RepID=UPI0038C9803D
MRLFKRHKPAELAEELMAPSFEHWPQVDECDPDQLVFQAVFRLNTHLDYLLMHGRVLCLDALPEEVAFEQGSWLRFANSMFNCDDDTVTTDAGALSASSYLQYTIMLKKIVASDKSVNDKIALFLQVVQNYPLFEPIEKRLLANYKAQDIVELMSRFLPEDDRLFCCKDKPGSVLMIDAIDSGLARELARQGVTTISELLLMSDEQLLSVKGIRPVQAERIIAHKETVSSLLLQY